jgi:hypothetical protein
MEPLESKKVIKRPLTSSAAIRKRTTDIVSSPADFLLDTHKVITNNNNNNNDTPFVPTAPTNDNNRTKKLISPRLNVHNGKGKTWDGERPLTSSAANNKTQSSNKKEIELKVHIPHISNNILSTKDNATVKVKKVKSPKKGRADTAPTPSSFCENSDFEDPSVVTSKSDNEISTTLFPVKPMENVTNIQGINISTELSRRSVRY